MATAIFICPSVSDSKKGWRSTTSASVPKIISKLPSAEQKASDSKPRALAL